MTRSKPSVTLPFTTLDVFTTERFQGNPLAIVQIPSSIRPQVDRATKQRIAREFNYSETVFLHTSNDTAEDESSAREIDIFTPDEELPFAGHPTIGSTFLILNHLCWKGVDTLRTKAGIIPIQDGEHTGRKGVVRAAIPHAVRVHHHTLADVALGQDELSADADIRAAELAAPVVSIVRGMTYILVRLPSLEHLARVSTDKRLDLGAIDGLLDEGEWGKGFRARYYYVVGEQPAEGPRKEEEQQQWKIRSRMVELSNEDPGTGSAACTLASYLAIEHRALKGARFEITQGVEMGRKSDIIVEARAVEKAGGLVGVKELFLGGTARVVMEGALRI